MAKGRCIGLLGGVGAGAAAYYYLRLAELHRERGLTLDLAMVHAEMGNTVKAVEAGDPQWLAEYFCGLVQRMAAAGAEFAVIPSVTSHYPLDELRVISPIPIVDIFEPLKAEVARRGIRRVGVFGTKYVMGSKLFGRVPGLEFVTATADEAEYVHETYMAIAWRGRATEQDFAGLTRLGAEFCRREKLDAIVLGGTELALVFHEGNLEFPAVNCAELQIAAVMGLATS
jgi:aspartate racemase